MHNSVINLESLNATQHPDRSVRCGWDHGLQTFYVTVLDKTAEDDLILVDVGVLPGELDTPQQVIDLVAAYAAVPSDLEKKLTDHRAADTATPNSLARTPGHSLFMSKGMISPAVVATRATAQPRTRPPLDARVDYLLIEPDGTSSYGTCTTNENLLKAVNLRIPGFVVPKSWGDMCVWYDDDFFFATDPPRLHNPLADYVITNLGFPHQGWGGNIAVSMNCDQSGDTPPLTNSVRARLDQLLDKAHPPSGSVTADADVGVDGIDAVATVRGAATQTSSTSDTTDTVQFDHSASIDTQPGPGL
ncbi:hypothetical protein ACL02S_23210 [Nocardia sp. 004]|uniref:hypothetical protein n=1 Tax=Nocardia sp. 004 TaxID=3385978 RepID=UPI0039A222D7